MESDADEIRKRLLRLEADFAASIRRILDDANRAIDDEAASTSAERMLLTRRLVRHEILTELMMKGGEPSEEVGRERSPVGEAPSNGTPSMTSARDPTADAKEAGTSRRLILGILAAAADPVRKDVVKAAVLEAGLGHYAYNKMRTKLKSVGHIEDAGDAWRLTDEGRREFDALEGRTEERSKAETDRRM